jgi:hypothetical protein
VNCNNKIKTTCNIIKKETGKAHSTEQVFYVLMKVGKLKDPENMTTAIDDFFVITITEKLHIRHVKKIHWCKIWTLKPGYWSASASSLIET